MSAKKNKAVVPLQVPASLVCWDLEHWPAAVFPHDGDAGRHLYRENAKSLMASGAVKRRGRRLVFFGEKYLQWLIKYSSNAISYEIAPNRPEHAASRNNGAAHTKEA